MNQILFKLEPGWKEVLEEELKKPYVTKLAAFVARERAINPPVYPPQELVFNAFWKTPFKKVKVVIVGQDPYHGPGQAHGLSFSVPKGVAPPPSLKNIFKEIQEDLGLPQPQHGCLLHWAKQGVLLLNAALTVKQSKPLSHHKQGWEELTDAAIRALAQRKEPVVFLLWGKFAQEKCLHLPELTQNKQHTVLKAPHPSPFSAHSGFFGCRHFSKVNEVLQKNGKKPIDWTLPS